MNRSKTISKKDRNRGEGNTNEALGFLERSNVVWCGSEVDGDKFLRERNLFFKKKLVYRSITLYEMRSEEDCSALILCGWKSNLYKTMIFPTLLAKISS